MGSGSHHKCYYSFNNLSICCYYDWAYLSPFTIQITEYSNPKYWVDQFLNHFSYAVASHKSPFYKLQIISGLSHLLIHLVINLFALNSPFSNVKWFDSFFLFSSPHFIFRFQTDNNNNNNFEIVTDIRQDLNGFCLHLRFWWMCTELTHFDGRTAFWMPLIEFIVDDECQQFAGESSSWIICVCICIWIM